MFTCLYVHANDHAFKYKLLISIQTEHIDNPKGYPDNARQYHPKLRPPVDVRLLTAASTETAVDSIHYSRGSWKLIPAQE